MTASRVAIIYGGPSAEHAISVQSADSLGGWLSEAGQPVLLAHWRRNGRWAFRQVAPGSASGAQASELASSGADVPLDAAVRSLVELASVIFPIVHGTFGEDGSLQGFASVLRIPCVGSSLLASALAMDKPLAKERIRTRTRVRVPRGLTVTREDVGRGVVQDLVAAEQLGFPCVVKPADAGSSVGLSKANGADELGRAAAAAFEVEGVGAVLIEEFIAGVELSVALVEDEPGRVRALPPVLIRPREGDLFDWHAKYTPGACEEICPAPLDADLIGRVERAAVEAFRALCAGGFGRADFIVRDREPFFLELNTLPGLTSGSLLPKAASAAGLRLPRFFGDLVERARGDARSLAHAGSGS